MRGIFCTQLVLLAQKCDKQYKYLVYSLWPLSDPSLFFSLFVMCHSYTPHPEFLCQLCFWLSGGKKDYIWIEIPGQSSCFLPWTSVEFKIGMLSVFFLCLRRSGAGITFPADWFLPVTICLRHPLRQARGTATHGEPLYLRVILWTASHWWNFLVKTASSMAIRCLLSLSDGTWLCLIAPNLFMY